MTIVLDSWAVIGYLTDASSVGTKVERLLARERPIMSWINLGEVFYIVRRRHGESAAAEAVRDLRHQIDAELPSAESVIATARIKSDHAMAYADAFAAATAIAHEAVLWTGDPELLIEGARWKWRDLRPATAT